MNIYRKQQGSVMVVSLITLIMIIGLTSAYLSFSTVNHKTIKTDIGKQKSRQITKAGIKAALVKLRELASADNEPKFAADENNNAPSETKNGTPLNNGTNAMINAWRNRSEFANGNWARYVKWHEKSFGNGNFEVDLFIRDDDKVAILWGVGVYNNSRSQILALYDIVPPSNPNLDITTIHLEGSKNTKILNGNGDFLPNVPITIDGNKTKISGLVHSAAGVELGSAEQEKYATPALGSTLGIPFEIKTNGGDGSIQVVGIPTQQDTDREPSTVNELTDWVKNNKDDASKNITTVELGKNDTLGTNDTGQYGTEDNYTTVYVDATGGGTLKLTDEFKGWGLLVIDVPKGDQASIKLLGQAEWHGLVIIRYQGDYNATKTPSVDLSAK